MINFEQFWIVVQGKLYTLFALIIADLILGVLLAIKEKRFDWKKLGDYLVSNGSQLVAWLIAEALLRIPAEFIPDGMIPVALWGVYATVVLPLIASILGHLTSFGLLPAGLLKGSSPRG